MRMEEFALGLFANSDKADRESPTQPPDVSLAGKFYISSLFFDVLTQFFPDRVLPPDLEEKRRYAKYRTMQIRNRQPIDPQSDAPTLPVPPVAAAPPELKNAPVSKTGFQYADSGSSEESPMLKPTVPPPQPVSTKPVVETVISSKGGTVSRSDGLNAKKKLQQAISAIDFGDYQTAAKLCSESLSLLGFHSN